MKILNEKMFNRNMSDKIPNSADKNPKPSDFFGRHDSFKRLVAVAF